MAERRKVAPLFNPDILPPHTAKQKPHPISTLLAEAAFSQSP
jgi:hypothetical protein